MTLIIETPGRDTLTLHLDPALLAEGKNFLDMIFRRNGEAFWSDILHYRQGHIGRKQWLYGRLGLVRLTALDCRNLKVI